MSSKILIVAKVDNKDFQEYINLAYYLDKLQMPKDHDVMLYLPEVLSDERKTMVANAFATSFEKVYIRERKTDVPRGTVNQVENFYWKNIAEIVGGKQQKLDKQYAEWFYLDLLVTPLKKDWIYRLEKNLDFSKRRVLGASTSSIVEGKNRKHIIKASVYPANIMWYRSETMLTSNLWYQTLGDFDALQLAYLSRDVFRVDENLKDVIKLNRVEYGNESVKIFADIPSIHYGCVDGSLRNAILKSWNEDRQETVVLAPQPDPAAIAASFAALRPNVEFVPKPMRGRPKGRRVPRKRGYVEPTPNQEALNETVQDDQTREEASIGNAGINQIN